MSKLINLTPHAISLDDVGYTLTVPPSGTVLRATCTQFLSGNINGFVVNRSAFDLDVNTLPEQLPDTYYVVSTLVLQALKELNISRSDFVAPDTSPVSAVRNEAGQIIGVKGFQVL